MADLKFGLALSPTEWRRASRAEALGYDSLWSGEHVVFHGPTYDALMTLAFFAQQTERIAVGSSVLLVPLRHPVPLAKAIGTLDVLAGGRLILGIGVGGEYPAEFEACGVPIEERGARTDEAVQLMRRLWREDRVSFAGRFFSVPEISMVPKPAQAGGPPIWVAGRSEAAIRRAARLGDGYLPYLFSPDHYRTGLGRLREEAERLGRDPASIVPGVYQFICLADPYEEARRQADEALSRMYHQPFGHRVDRYCVLGNGDDCRRRLEDYVAAGARYFVLSPLRPPDRSLEPMEAIARDVLPRIRDASGK